MIQVNLQIIMKIIDLGYQLLLLRMAQNLLPLNMMDEFMFLTIQA
jgi:hypothetical protein